MLALNYFKISFDSVAIWACTDGADGRVSQNSGYSRAPVSTNSLSAVYRGPKKNLEN
jgi:hypothetical protein